MHVKRCIQNNIFMLIADHVHITISGGLGCIWCHLYIGKCVQNFVQKNIASPGYFLSYLKLGSNHLAEIFTKWSAKITGYHQLFNHKEFQKFKFGWKSLLIEHTSWKPLYLAMQDLI